MTVVHGKTIRLQLCTKEIKRKRMESQYALQGPALSRQKVFSFIPHTTVQMKIKSLGGMPNPNWSKSVMLLSLKKEDSSDIYNSIDKT